MPDETITPDTTTADAAAAAAAGSVTPNDEPKVLTFTQDKLDRIIAARVAETKAQFADHETLKARAAKADELEAASLSELERATKRADDAEAAAAKATLDAAQVLLDAQRTAIAAKAGLPDELAELLKGDT